LRDLQESMRSAILAGDDRIAAWVAVDGAVQPEARLDIYRNTYPSVTARALRLNYPAVLQLLGDACFAGIAHAYARAHPPASPWLDAYGADFAAFLSTRPETAAVRYVADVARIEWAVTTVLHADDAVPLGMPAWQALTQLPAQRQAAVRFDAHPAVRLVHLRFPGDSIWRAVLARDDAALAAIDPSAEPRWLLVERSQAGVAIQRLGEGEWRLALALLAGASLEQALDAVRAWPSLDAVGQIAAHLVAGRFTGFRMHADAGQCQSKDNAP
jgi:hypothetical protein